MNSGNLAFLQGFVGIERVAEQLGVAAQDFAVAQFGASGAGAQLIELMLHLRARIVGSVDQSLIEASQSVANSSQIPLQACRGLIERLLHFLRQTACGKPLAERS